MSTAIGPELRLELEELYARYAECLDDGPLDAWPEFFTEACLYLVIPRENHDQGLPLAIMRCESRGMLADRIRAAQETVMHEPRHLRHHITNLRGRVDDDGRLRVTSNYSVIEVLTDELPRILSVGRYLDVLERGDDGVLRFDGERCVYDSVLVPNTIIYPI